MNKISGRLAIGIAALAFIPNGSAVITLSFEPTPQSNGIGESVSVDIVVSGLRNVSSPSLGAFEIELIYNSAVLTGVSTTFGSFLDLGTFGSLQFSDLSTPGVIHVDETSFESANDLNDSQMSSFTLAKLGFTGLASGTSPLVFTFASLSDENGRSLDFAINNGLIEVARGSNVPDAGSTASLLSTALAGVFAARRRAVLR